jgi:aspartyl-tRNA(Asn)/glutamyl-tRNA(Gln) amidotransferase subunit A
LGEHQVCFFSCSRRSSLFLYDGTMPMNTLLQARAALDRQQVSSSELVERALEIALQRADLNVFAHLDADGARARAARCDEERQKGTARGVLHGVPITIKDLFNVVGLPTQGGTRALLPEAFQHPVLHAKAVQHLVDAGAIVLGKVNMHEIALGITGENSWTGDVKNPIDPDRQAGGSSSGSAAAVASGIGLASLGSDTGGSVRIPASFCGVVGFKPTLGWIGLEGALHLSMTCDHAGALTRDVRDAHALLEVLSHRNLPLAQLDHLRGVRIGVPRVWLEGRLGVTVRREFETLLERLRGAGAQVFDIAPQHFELASACYGPIVRAEAAFVHRQALQTYPEGFSDIVRPALENGQLISVAAYLEARAQRRLVRAGLQDAFREVDAIMLPCAPMGAPKRGTTEVELESGLRPHRDAFIELTLPFSLVGVPTLSMPFAQENGMPVGLQIVTAGGDDARALEIGLWLEQNIALRT